MTTKLCFDVVRKLKEKKLTLATAESCTGGGIGAAITAIPGSSACYKGGIISYTNEIKNTLLGVDNAILSAFGAVSGETAEAMAKGAMKALNADIVVSLTGLAGPDGDDRGNSVGTVYIGICHHKTVSHKKFLFTGDRQQVREQAICEAIRMILADIS